MKSHIGYLAVMPRIDDLHRQAAAERLAADFRRSARSRERRSLIGRRRRPRRVAPAGGSPGNVIEFPRR